MNVLGWAAALVGWVGAALAISTTRWARRPTLAARLAPYLPGVEGIEVSGRNPGRPIVEVLGPLGRDLADGASRLVGLGDDLGVRLERARLNLTPTEFRSRQAGWTALAAVATTAGAASIGLAAPVAGIVVLAVPATVFLVFEQRVIAAASLRQQRAASELPIVAEQLGMLLSAGYSLGGALHRLARRGEGVCATELQVVCSRTRQGLSDFDALSEWADRFDVDALHRLVSILSLHEQTTDLGALVSAEARSMRREAHRSLLATLDRRAQQVWIPVTVAALVPGVMFIAVPFIEALRHFSST